MALPSGIITPETLITLKVSCDDTARKIKLPLKELNAAVLPDKLRNALSIPSDAHVIIERYSDSLGGYIVLDKANPPVYKALVRAAKAKGKLRLKVTIEESDKTNKENATSAKATRPAASAMAVATPASLAANLMCVKPRLSGAGIFEYRSAMQRPQSGQKQDATLPQLVHEGRPATSAPSSQPPVEVPTHAEHSHPAEPSPSPSTQSLVFRTRETTAFPVLAQTAWSVYCNACDAAMPDVHYHCSICDGGDYDLCETCVANGAMCLGEDHWLIKRFIRDGKVVTSVTERAGRKLEKEAPEAKSTPDSFAVEPKPATETALPEPTRTCNSCVVVLPEREFITCTDCQDFDLCVPCHTNNMHGHNSKHTFCPAAKETVLSVYAQSLLKAGRNVAHNAICDGCNKKIFGIRHKCLNCPDWDLCGDCYVTAGKTHPRHRFAPIYEQLADPVPSLSRHFGIYCDGPLCRAQKDQGYIVGDRYKCAVCHDTDFCASCEASPTLAHNRTHPLIKFRTAVRNVSITTTNEDNNGNVRNMGDRRPQPAAAVSTQPPVNTATAVQTVAEIPPTEEKATGHHVAQPRDGDIPVSSNASGLVTRPSAPIVPVAPALLTAAFVRDTVPDGTVMAPGALFTQIWTLRNEGPFVWPPGCSVRFVGGDNMLNVDSFHPSSATTIAHATESSVVGREVQVGEEISFRIMLRAPKRQGKSISYWRLKAVDGTPFGHRLWCDIEVRDFAEQDSGEKVINAPTQPAFAPVLAQHPGQDAAAARVHHSRVQAMRETQVRLLQHQRMLQHAQHPRPEQRAVSAPMLPRQTLLNQAGAERPDSVHMEAEKLRKEAAKARVEAIKAKIMRYRAENAKLHAKMQETTAAIKREESTGKDVSAEEGPKSTHSPVVAPVKEDDAELGASSTTSSQMVFPKLEKESPASSSIISAKPAYVQREDGQVEHSATVPAETEHEDEPETSPLSGDFDELELVSADVSSADEDDGFLTDEEYDILDASDRETVASP